MTTGKKIKWGVATFKAVCESQGMPPAEEEYLFHPTRKWRFDLCWPGMMIAFEREGDPFAVAKDGSGKSRHTTGVGYERDCEKYSEAAVLGWAVIRATPAQLASGQALAWVLEAARRARERGLS